MTKDFRDKHLMDAFARLMAATTAAGKHRSPDIDDEDLAAEVLAAADEAVPICAADEAQMLADRVADLEEALHQAQWTVQFMHGCLTEESYQYAYPDQTEAKLDEWHRLAPAPELCVHSHHEPGCAACDERVRRMDAKAERQARAAER